MSELTVRQLCSLLGRTRWFSWRARATPLHIPLVHCADANVLVEWLKEQGIVPRAWRYESFSFDGNFLSHKGKRLFWLKPPIIVHFSI